MASILQRREGLGDGAGKVNVPSHVFRMPKASSASNANFTRGGINRYDGVTALKGMGTGITSTSRLASSSMLAM